MGLEAVAIINAVLAFVAFLTSAWAVPKVGKPLSIILCVAAALAFFYSGAYIWLAFNITQVAAWSNVLRWFGLLSWPVVWIAVPLAMVRYKQLSGRVIRKAARPDNVITPIAGLDVQEILNRDDYHG